MPSPSPEARFFGIDLHAAWQEIRRPWHNMHRWPVLSWLTPEAPVRLLHANGSTSVWIGSVAQTAPAGSAAAFTAVELPDDCLLRRVFSMPLLDEADVANAVALEVQAMSPFSAQDTVSGYRVQSVARGMRPVEVIVASHKQIARYLATQAERLQQVAEPEVWVLSAQGRPIALGGYGIRQRVGYGTRWRRTGYALIGLAAVLLIAMAVTPTAQLAMRATEAWETYQAAQRRVAPMVRQREALLQSAEQLNALAEVMGARIEPLRMQDMLTRVLPDDTSLQNLRLQGNKVTISGLTADASVLMQLLSTQPGVTNVRAPSAATRIGLATKESFSIEFLLDAQKFGMGGTQAVAAVAAVAADAKNVAQGAPVLPATPVPPIAAPAAPPSAPLPGASGVTGVAGAGANPATSAVGASSSAAASATVAAPAPPAAAIAKPSGAATFGGAPTFGGSPTKPATAPVAAASAKKAVP